MPGTTGTETSEYSTSTFFGRFASNLKTNPFTVGANL
jgi:hypothetical protein